MTRINIKETKKSALPSQKLLNFLFLLFLKKKFSPAQKIQPCQARNCGHTTEKQKKERYREFAYV